MKTNKGSALFIVTIMIVMVMGMMVALMQYSMSTSKAIYYSNESISREFAAESGLTRAETAYKADSKWLIDNDGKTVEFNFDNYQVSIAVNYVGRDNNGSNCYLVQSTASDGGGDVKTVAHVAVDNPTLFQYGDYARFIGNKGNMNVGNNSIYGGKVFVNGNINVVGKGVVFEDDVSATGNVNGNKDTKFMKNHDSGVDENQYPFLTADGLKDKASKAQEDLCFDTSNTKFKNRFAASTLYGPSDDDIVTIHVSFNTTNTGANKGTTMTVVSTIETTVSGSAVTYTMTEDFDVNSDSQYYDQAIYCENDVTVSGETNGRNTIITPTNINIDGPIRYVNESGDPLYVFKNVQTGEINSTFTEQFENWSSMGQWTGANYEYVATDDLLKYIPSSINYDPSNGKPPVLGLMAGTGIDVTGGLLKTSDGKEYDLMNRELHAALFCSTDGVGYNIDNKEGSAKKSNIYINGCVIDDGTEPTSGPFSYRTFGYDQFLKLYPPPEFNSTTNSGKYKATNWHLVR